MAGHKTKYKKPKDLEASESKAFLKKQIRKDIKDYIIDKYEGYNPNTVEDKQQNVLRKTDKQVIDDVENMVPNKKEVADYYKVNGEHDPKYTAKERAKLQDEDEKSSKDQIQDKIENLTREGKERLVREYVRRKIRKVIAEELDPVGKEDADINNDGKEDESDEYLAARRKAIANALKEQDETEDAPTETEPEEEEEGGTDDTIDPTQPIETPTAEPTAAPTAAPTAPTTAPTAAPEATPSPAAPAEAPVAEPAATPTATKSPEETTSEFIKDLVGVRNKAAFVSKAFHMAYADADPADLKMAIKMLVRSLFKTMRLNKK